MAAAAAAELRLPARRPGRRQTGGGDDDGCGGVGRGAAASGPPACRPGRGAAASGPPACRPGRGDDGCGSGPGRRRGAAAGPAGPQVRLPARQTGGGGGDDDDGGGGGGGGDCGGGGGGYCQYIDKASAGMGSKFQLTNQNNPTHRIVAHR